MIGGALSSSTNLLMVGLWLKIIDKRNQMGFHGDTVWWFQTFFIFHSIWDNPSHCLIFFKMVKTTNQVHNGDGRNTPFKWQQCRDLAGQHLESEILSELSGRLRSEASHCPWENSGCHVLFSQENQIQWISWLSIDDTSFSYIFHIAAYSVWSYDPVFSRGFLLAQVWISLMMIFGGERGERGCQPN